MACCLTKWRRPWTPDHTSDEDAHLNVMCSKLLTGEIYVGVDVDSNNCPEHYDIVDAYQIIVADAADAVSVNFSGRCKFYRFNAKNWHFRLILREKWRFLQI